MDNLPLHKACLLDDFKGAKKAVHTDPYALEKYARCPEGGIDLYKRPIHIAAMLGHTRCLELLVEKKASLEGQGKASALEYAASHGHLACMSLLHRNSAYLSTTALRATMLHACIRGMWGVALWLSSKYRSQLKRHSAQILLTLSKQNFELPDVFTHLLYRLNPVSARQIGTSYASIWPSLQYLGNICFSTPLHLAIREDRLLEVIRLLRAGHTLPTPNNSIKTKSAAIQLALKDARRAWCPQVAYCWPSLQMRRARLLLLIAVRKHLFLPVDVLTHIQGFCDR